MKKTLSIILAAVIALACMPLIFAEESETPYVSFNGEKSVELNWPDASEPFTLEYSTGGAEHAYIIYSITGDLELHDGRRANLKNTSGSETIYVKSAGKGGTVTANLYSAENELLASDTLTLSIPLYKKILYPFALAGSESLGLIITGGLLNIWVVIPLIMAFFSAPFNLIFG